MAAGRLGDTPNWRHIILPTGLAICALLTWWLASAADATMGLTRPRTYLVLLQNNDELRPTGGFIGTYATVTVSGGRLAEFEFGDSYALRDKVGRDVVPPEPLVQAGIADWQFHDSNWSPDFPTSAGYAATFYRLATGRDADGVVALDTAVLAPLLQAVGPVSVPGSPVEITSENVRQEIEARRPSSPDQEAAHKQFVRDVARAVAARLRTGGPAALWRLAPGLAQASRERHLMVSTHGHALSWVIGWLHWDGRIEADESDYLLVVDANLYGNKIEPELSEVLAYDVDLSYPQAPTASLTLAYEHRGSWAWPSGVYKDYRRVYVPYGSRLSEPGGRGPNVDTVVGLEGDRTVWGDWLWLEPGQAATVTYSYQLPPHTVSRAIGVWHYELLVQKQAGTAARPLVVRLTLPSGAETRYVHPTPYSTSSSTVVFQTTLVTDQRIVLEFATD